MLRSLVLSAFLLGLPGLAHAKAFKLGGDEPVSWITIPDTWDPETFENGVSGTSPDKETYVAAEIVDGKEIDDALKETDEFFAKQKIKLKGDTKKEGKVTFAGLPAYQASWDATDADGPTHVVLTLVKVSDDKLVMFTYWGSEKGSQSNAAEIDEISKSVKPIK